MGGIGEGLQIFDAPKEIWRLDDQGRRLIIESRQISHTPSFLIKADLDNISSPCWA